ncbi:HNH endonuclease [Halorubrum ezzemoulense]|uniref:HNH endonuclease n=1 Tax=Halorubrum ezzemoulense TaxID=337243 RepID=A0A256JFW1_HALEZ|nr:HNH endonuclease [Halorubrum ezzemoulense]OYR64867.1 HNH endonuclease [Halorubrum ezzemoulense]OYR67661.1 HNH endonuclease [Halorubrum ezzemoulense]
MTDDEDDTSEELGKTGEKMGGIADRFGAATDTTETSETGNTTETTETIDTSGSASTPSTDMTETTETTTTTETGETIETSDTTDTLGPDDEGFVLREDWNGRTIYLPDDDVDELDIRYSEVNVQWQREHGEQLPKNERFYPAVIRAGLSGTSIEEELGLE